MNILHYAGINENPYSGTSVQIPKIVSAQTEYANIGFYNYGGKCYDLDPNIKNFSDRKYGDDYLCFDEPFNHPDLVVFHSPFGILGCLRIARRLRHDKIPYVIAPHGCFARRAMKVHKIKKFIAVYIIMRSFIKHSAAIQYLSPGEMQASLFHKKGIIISNGIDLKPYQKREVKDGIRFLFIGRKDPEHKGLDILIKACGCIKEQLKLNHATVSLYGPDYKGGEETISNLICENELSDLVFSYSGVTGEEKEKVLQSHHVLVLTSRFEGQPYVVIEAMSSGMPVLVTPGTNFADIVYQNKCGWCSQLDEIDLSQKLLYIISHPNEISEFSMYAYDYVKNHLVWTEVAKEAIDLYKKIICS